MKGQWFQDCKEYYLKEKLSKIPGEDLAELLSKIGKEARNWIYGLLQLGDRPGITK